MIDFLGMPNADLQRRKTLEEDHPDVSEWTVDLSTKQEAANDSRSSTADAQKVVLEERSHQQELDDEVLFQIDFSVLHYFVYVL